MDAWLSRHRQRLHHRYVGRWSTPARALPPGDLRFVSTGVGAILFWTDYSYTETGFEIWRKDGAAAFALIDTVAAGVTTYADSGLSPATTYQYYVKATAAYGDSDRSGYAFFTTGPRPILQSGAIHTVSGLFDMVYDIDMQFLVIGLDPTAWVGCDGTTLWKGDGAGDGNSGVVTPKTIRVDAKLGGTHSCFASRLEYDGLDPGFVRSTQLVPALLDSTTSVSIVAD